MNLLSLDIRMLRSLTSVADTGSITETARQLGRTQPAISLQIQRLEEITGKALFRHEGRRMQLTQDGDMVLGYAKSILRLHDELLSRLSSPDVQGHVVVGVDELIEEAIGPQQGGIDCNARRGFALFRIGHGRRIRSQSQRLCGTPQQRGVPGRVGRR